MALSNLFHSHVWNDVSTQYVPPVTEGETEQDRYGYTRLFQRCERCGEYQDSSKFGHLVINGVPETLDRPPAPAPIRQEYP